MKISAASWFEKNRKDTECWLMIRFLKFFDRKKADGMLIKISSKNLI